MKTLTPERTERAVYLYSDLGWSLGRVARDMVVSQAALEATFERLAGPAWRRRSRAALRAGLSGGALNQETAPAPAPAPALPAQAADGRPVLVEVPVANVVPDPDNPREDVGDVTELASSMDSAGLLQPIVCRRRESDGRLVVVAGHRRLAAAQQLGWLTVPVIVRRDMRPDSVLAAMLIENGQRRDLDPIEEARALHRLKVQSGCSSSELAARIGRSQGSIDRRLTLLQLPVEEQEVLRAGQMTLGEAVKRSRVAAGTARPKGYTGSWYLGQAHKLATRARARCQRLHKRPRLLGAVACGECWESVIRADEREHLHTHSAQTGSCALCGSEIDRAGGSP